MANKGTQELTHDEVWDDSELQDSWNAAFEEYKKYHSLAARGEQVEALPPLRSKAEALLANGTSSSAKQTASSTTVPANFIGPARPPTPHPTHTTTASVKANQPGAPPVTTSTTHIPMPPGLASLPQNMLGSSNQDESLKNIMMSWYYAGYYTGFYEGQQKAWGDMQTMHEGG